MYSIVKAVVQRFSVKKMFLKVAQDLQENTCAEGKFSKVAGQSPASL